MIVTSTCQICRDVLPLGFAAGVVGSLWLHRWLHWLRHNQCNQCKQHQLAHMKRKRSSGHAPGEPFAFFCLHPGCGIAAKPFETWHGLTRHNARKHATSPEYVNLSNGQDLPRKKLRGFFRVNNGSSDGDALDQQSGSAEDLHLYELHKQDQQVSPPVCCARTSLCL